jgi:kelch-like protein 2/3
MKTNLKVGGYCGLSRECLDSVERYDPFSDTWSPVAHMTTRRSGACVNVHNGKIFVVGGHNGPCVLKSVEMYDPTCNRWTLISELNVARRNAGKLLEFL